MNFFTSLNFRLLLCSENLPLEHDVKASENIVSIVKTSFYLHKLPLFTPPLNFHSACVKCIEFFFFKFLLLEVSVFYIIRYCVHTFCSFLCSRNQQFISLSHVSVFLTVCRAYLSLFVCVCVCVCACLSVCLYFIYNFHYPSLSLPVLTYPFLKTFFGSR